MENAESGQGLVDAALNLALEVMQEGRSHADYLAALADWIREDSLAGGALDDPADAPLLACQLSRAIWSVLPNPAKGFHIERIAPPGRNDRCVAGLDCKHKQCCASAPMPPPFPPEMGWAFLAEALEADQLNAMLASGRLPDGMLAMAAERLVDEDPERAVEMLLPRFAKSLPKGEHADHLLMCLADALDELGRGQEKWALLQRMASDARGALQAAACQRLASMYSDKGDFDAAWASFKAAQRADPHDLALSHLEVSILLSEGRTEDGKQAARKWLPILQRRNEEGRLATVIELMENVARTGDLSGAHARLAARDADAWTLRFIAAVDRGLAKPPQVGRVHLDAGVATDTEAKSDAVLEQAMITQSMGMGLSRAEARKEAAKVAKQIAATPMAGSGETESEAGDSKPDREERFLQSTPALAKIERAWHQAWPLAKPFSVHPLPMDEGDVWAEPGVGFWVEFLENHPEALDSLDVIDDLVIAIELAPAESDWHALVPTRCRLLVRARQIMAPFIDARTHLPWGFVQSRPGLRLLVAHAFEHEERNDPAFPRLLAEILSLNPNDNHGLRERAMRGLLMEGDDAGALALAEGFPDDAMPAISFGRALALYRLGRRDDASAALVEACEYSPKVPKWLLPATKKQPKMGEFGIRSGGDDEAWLYREGMRAVWSSTPGAMEWLKSTIK